ncbi:MAG: hypothetical protein PHU71_03115 [Candidatus Gracilibacteria bacterium]|nr:hypothetical protein [Candidatus Gracilibacteria bacterium]
MSRNLALSPAEIDEITPLVEAAGVELQAFLEAVQQPGFLGRGKSLKQVLLTTSAQSAEQPNNETINRDRITYILHFVDLFKRNNHKEELNNVSQIDQL